MVASVEASYGKTTETIDSASEQIRDGTSKSTTTNSGSVNTTDIVGSNSTNASVNTTGTAASTNTLTHGATTSTTTNSGRTDTTQLLLTQDAVDYLVKGILENTNTGLAQITSGKNISGVYNDTSTTFLANDLISRTAGEVAARSAVTQTVIGASSSTTTTGASTDTQNIGATSGFQNIGATSGSSIQKGVQTIGASTSTTDVINHDVVNGTAQSDKTGTETQAKVKAGWILCTELRKQNRMNKVHYYFGLKAFEKYKEENVRGYYIWAIPALKHLRENPFSLRSRILAKLLQARAEYLSAEAGYSYAEKTVIGFFAKHLYWGCWILSKTLARNYTPKTIEEDDVFRAIKKGVNYNG